MKITVLQSNFAKVLGGTSRIVGNRVTLPVLNNILISAQKGKIKFSATDLEVGISSTTIGKIDEEGDITLPARLLSDFVLNNKDESIDLVVKGTMAKIKSTRFEANINGIAAEEFPSIPEAKGGYKIKISKEKLASALKKVIIAPANDETRPVLAGICFQFNNNSLTLAATDSYRLAEKKIEIEGNPEAKNIIVPTRTISEVFRMITGSDATGDIDIICSDNQINFNIDGTKIVSRLIEGSYPAYAQIIPKNSPITVIANLSELLSAVKLSSLFAKEASNNNIKLIVKDGSLTVSSISSQVGDAKSKVAAEITGGDVEVSFNARYLSDVLAVLGQEKVKIGLKDSGSAATITTSDDKDYVYIVMPLKLD
ncbi:MAG: DNA polymerase III subunit beta [Candidatus Berkelbacteria bacterium]